MSENVTSDPRIPRLARFTPTTAGIDRDAILFAAGQASASTGRVWKLATATLAISQSTMIGVWLFGSTAPPTPVERPEPSRERHSESSYVNLIRQWERGGAPAIEANADDSPPMQPTLTIASGRHLPEID